MSQDIKEAVDPKHHKQSLRIPKGRIKDLTDPETGDVVLQYMDVCEFIMTEEQFLGHLMGQELKYFLRNGKKDPPLQEASKQNWYTERKIQFFEWLNRKENK